MTALLECCNISKTFGAGLFSKHQTVPGTPRSIP
jgi:hypothetical protein